MFFLDINGEIKYMTGINGSIPNIDTIQSLNKTAIFTPSVHTDGRYIYLVYVDEKENMHLNLLNLTEIYNGWQELDFPVIKSQLRPAITGGVSDWLTIAFYNFEHGVQKIATNEDILQPNAWLNQLDINYDPNAGIQKYWLPIYGVTWRSVFNLGIVRQNDYTIVVWSPDQYHLAFWFAKYNGEYGGYVEKYGFAYGGISFTLSNNTLFGTYRDWDRRINIDRFDLLIPNYPRGGYGPPQAHHDQEAWLTKKCQGDPSITFTQQEQGKHPAIICGWLDSNNKIKIRTLSIDTNYNPINYEGHP